MLLLLLLLLLLFALVVFSSHKQTNKQANTRTQCCTLRVFCFFFFFPRRSSSSTLLARRIVNKCSAHTSSLDAFVTSLSFQFCLQKNNPNCTFRDNVRFWCCLRAEYYQAGNFPKCSAPNALKNRDFPLKAFAHYRELPIDNDGDSIAPKLRTH